MKGYYPDSLSSPRKWTTFSDFLSRFSPDNAPPFCLHPRLTTLMSPLPYIPVVFFQVFA